MNGWKWVPVEPTDVMVERICAAHAGGGWPDDYGLTAQRIRREHARGGYASMLAAAPTPPAEAVTDAMVEAAVDAWTVGGGWRDRRDASLMRQRMRAAITAALAARGRP